jgi:hypothetical protein
VYGRRTRWEASTDDGRRAERDSDRQPEAEFAYQK